MPDGAKVLTEFDTSSYDCSQSALFDVATGRAVREIAFSPVLWHGLKWSPDGRRALTRAPGVHRLWDVERGRPLQSIGIVRKGWGFPMPTVTFSENGKYIFSWEQWGAFFWDVETGQPIHHDPPTEGQDDERGIVNGKTHAEYYAGQSVRSPDGRLLASWYKDHGERKQVLLWDVSTAEVVRTLDHGDLIPMTLAFAPDGHQLAVRCVRDTMVIWDADTGAKRGSLHFSPGDSGVEYFWTFAYFLPDGQLQEFTRMPNYGTPPAPYDGFPVPSPEVLERFRTQVSSAIAVHQTADGRRLIVYEADGSVSQWDGATGNPICRCYLFENGGKWLTVLPDDRCAGNLEYVRFRPK